MADTACVIAREVESQVVSEFLDAAAPQPGALVVEGEAGIGKTTFWLGVIEQARQAGFRILSTRSAAAEAVLAYTSLADLLGDIDPATWSALPEPQRRAIDAVLLRTGDQLPTNPRAVSAGFIAVVERLAARQPVLLAIDDMQWLDPSSAAVLAFASRRFVGSVRIIGTVRGQLGNDDAGWLQPHRPDALRRIRLPPMSVGELHAVISQRLGHSLPRPTLLRIHEVSGGNPFFAIELARAIGDGVLRATDPLPGALADVVDARLANLSLDARDVLLVAACSAEPTVALVTQALEADTEVVAKGLEEAEIEEIVALEGSRVRFCHPLFRYGIYTGASTVRRREIHRILAKLEVHLETRARHLALAATTGDPATVDALVAAARAARVRGAPISAAELFELAIQLDDGDAPEYRIELARCHFEAGDPGRADDVLEQTMHRLPRGPIRAEAANTLAIVRLLTDNFATAANLLEETIADAVGNLALTVQMLITLAFALLNVGKTEAASSRAHQAVAEAERLGDTRLLSQALSMRAMLQFIRGDDYDAESMRRALSLEDRNAKVSTAFQPSAHQALLLSCTGALEEAHDAWAAVKWRCLEQGEHGELTFVLFHSGLLEIWRGNYDGAAEIADEAAELAQQLGGELPLLTAHALQGSVAAYAGREAEARRALHDAQIAAERTNARRLAEWSVNALGFLEVSLGNYEAALRTLSPLLPMIEAMPHQTEMIAAAFIPDAVEAYVHLGRLDEAEPLVAAIERNGRRLNRAWMLAIGDRCRAVLLAARGDFDGAMAAAQSAMTAHDRLPMPFERARTQLLLGQIQRRQRGKHSAAATLESALAAFDELKTPIWAARARDELSRVKVGPQAAGRLSASERRVAELAATGMTNREVAAVLFISPKTVESNLARAYRKLGIRTRAELGLRMGQGHS